MALVKMFGEKVTSKNGDVDVSSLSENDVIGIYFSAHWCPPCRQFTPQLAAYYTSLKKAGKKLEIVFASSDQSESQFQQYYDEMPWLALPFGDEHKDNLGKTYNVSGIPTLIFIDAKTGETITPNGRAVVVEDPKGDKFPWKNM